MRERTSLFVSVSRMDTDMNCDKHLKFSGNDAIDIVAMKLPRSERQYFIDCCRGRTKFWVALSAPTFVISGIDNDPAIMKRSIVIEVDALSNSVRVIKNKFGGLRMIDVPSWSTQDE